jgi:hypothetical protein
MKLINKGARRLGIPGRPAIILDPGRAVSITEAQLEFIRKNRTSGRWLESGVLEVSGNSKPVKVEVEVTPPIPPKRHPVQQNKPVKADEREVVELPEDVTGEGTETHHAGGGWYEVYVNGFKVTDRKVRKDEAASIAAEYD